MLALQEHWVWELEPDSLLELRHGLLSPMAQDSSKEARLRERHMGRSLRVGLGWATAWVVKVTETQGTSPDLTSIPSTPLWRRQWHPTPALLPGKSHGWRSLVGCSPWGHKESDTTEWLHTHFSLSCIGEGDGNPLQCSCLENPRDGGAWWAASYGVAQSRTWLKPLNSSNSPYYSRHLLTHTETSVLPEEGGCGVRHGWVDSVPGTYPDLFL